MWVTPNNSHRSNLKVKDEIIVMYVKWNDDAVYEFLMKFGVRHETRLQDAIGAIKRLKFKEISLDEIELRDPPYKIFIPRLEFHSKRALRKKSFGTFFCRHLDNGKYFVKDGNHRLYTLIAHGVKKFRIAYTEGNTV